MSATSVWVPEAPQFPGYYAAKIPTRRGKLNEQTELGTHNIHNARQFATQAECVEWIAAHPKPAWQPMEHGFMDSPP